MGNGCSVLIGDEPDLVGKQCSTTAQCGAEARCVAGSCVALDGGTGGGSSAGGSASGGTGGGSAAGGSAAGGSAAGGSAAGGSAAGGSSAGGSTGGGSTAGGSTGGGASDAGAPDAGFINTWVRLTPMGSITDRGQPVVGTDAASGSIFVFGGASSAGFLSDTWKLSVPQTQLTWSQVLASGTPPPQRSGFATVFDSARRKLYVHGGYVDAASGDGTTWAFDVATTTWSVVSTSGPARSYAAMAFDPTRNVALLFGGRIQPNDIDQNDVWQFNGTSWTQLTVSGTPPPAREDHSAFFDPVGNTLFIFGGFVSPGDPDANGRSDTWALSGFGGGTPTWQQVSAAPVPPARWGAGVAYDPDRRLFVLFGGAGARFGANAVLRGDTWTFNPATLSWREGLNGQPPLTSPSARYKLGLTWSPLHQRVLLFGGFGPFGSNMSYSDTWVYGGP
ncbi:MAG: hypothetical protein JNJ54_32975 [Myxococcaceae bacterium]|nr:hypothetical protein [Myxococcaceae bacterium]